MKLSEPKKIAFETDNDSALDFFEAQKNRADEFWEELETGFDVVGVRDGKPFRQTKHCTTCEQVVHDKIKESTLQHLDSLYRAIAGEKGFDFPLDASEGDFWTLVKFILAFDTSFTYFPEEEDAESLSDDSETDYLDDETSFRYDVVKACDSLALIGAAFSKRFGSDAYRLWADAMIKLGDRNERVQYKAADDIFEALVRTWADLRTWIFMKSAYKPTKPKSKSRKAKR